VTIAEQTESRIRALTVKRKAVKDTMDAAVAREVEEQELQRKASIKENERNGSKGECGDTGKSNLNPEEKQDDGDLPLRILCQWMGERTPRRELGRKENRATPMTTIRVLY
jgi:hypothetical protein